MVPRAANLLLALISTSAAAENLVRPLHGPYRLPSGPHGRRADFDTPLFPIGTGSTARASSSAAATPQEDTTSATIADSRPLALRETRQKTSSTSIGSHSNDGSPTASVPARTRNTTLELGGEFTASTKTPMPTAPTAVVVHETIVLRSNSSDVVPFTVSSRGTTNGSSSQVLTPEVVHETTVLHFNGSRGAQLTSLSRDTTKGSLNTTQPGTTGLTLTDSTSTRNSTQRAPPSDHVRPSAVPTLASNTSAEGLNSSHAGSASSSRGLDLSAHIVSTRNQTAAWHPPRPTACSGATLNIKSASLDYWYAETYTQVDSTFLIEFDENESSTGWTLIPATTDILNITSAMGNPACSSTALFDAELNQSGLEYACSETPTPAAKATSVVEQTAYTHPNATTSSGEIPDVVISPTPAALTVTNAGRESTYQAGTSVVHFSKFEIVDKSSYRHWNGSVDCVETTKVYDLPEQMSFEFDGETAVNESLAVGKLGRMSFALMQALDESEVNLQSVELGDLEAEPTVVVVVEKVVVAAAGIAQGVLAPAPSLETPTATLPPGLSFERTTPTQPGTTWVPFTAHVESSADALILPTKTSKKQPSPQQTSPNPAGVAIAEGGSTGTGVDGPEQGNGGRVSVIFPFVAHIENSAVTLAIPANPTNPPSVVTAQFGGRVVTATRLIGGGPISEEVNVGKVVSAIDKIAAPTNALEVLNNARASLSVGAAASAIAAGIGFSNPADGGSFRPGSDAGPGPVGGLSPNPELIIGNSVFTATRSGSNLVVGGQTMVAGGSPVMVAGQAVSLSPDGSLVFIGQRVVAINRGPDTETGFSLNVGSSDVEATRVANGLVIGGQTISPGGPAVFVNGRELSLGPDGTALSVGGSAVQIGDSGNVGAVANIPVIQLGTRRFTANAATQYNIDGTILVPGDQVVVASTTVSLGPSATRLLINGEEQRLTPPAITPGPLLTMGGHVYRPNLGSTYDIDSSLLTPGGLVVVSGTTLSLPASGQSIVVNGIARALGIGGSGDEGLATITAPPVLVLNGRAVSPNGGTSYIIYGQTLSPGGTITYEERSQPRTLSLNSAANVLVTIVDGQSYTSRIGMVGAAPAGAPVLTINGNTYSAVEYNAGSGATYVFDGTTLTPGGAITIAGPDGEETVSLLPAGTAIILELNGITSRSEIEDAYGVRPTNAPILTIGGETFTAVNNDATYFVDGQTISPGHVETVTIGRRTFIVSLSPYATIIEIVELASDGEAIATEFETLFPATVAAPPITSTAEPATRTGASVASTGSNSGSSADDESIALLSFSTTFVGALLALSSLALAIWL